MKQFFVYILTNKSGRVLYIGVTNSPERRVREHRDKTRSAFTGRYNVNRLIYIESFNDIHEAIHREKELKGWRRMKKIDLIKSTNPLFKDIDL